MPTISVIIPVFNKEHYIRRALSSVLNQIRRADEIIVIDDGSSDSSMEIVESLQLPQAKVIRRDRKGGPAAARNSGIKAATGEWIAFLDADDEWSPQFLSTVERLILEAPDAGFVFTGYDRVSHDGKKRVPHTFPASTYKRYSSRITLRDYAEIWMRDGSPPMCTDTAVCRSDILRDVGLFNEQCPRGSDTDMWVKMLSRTNAAYSTEILATYHRNPASVMATVSPNFRPCAADTIQRLIPTLSESDAVVLRKLYNTLSYRTTIGVMGRERINPSIEIGFFRNDDPLRYWTMKAVSKMPLPLAKVMRLATRAAQRISSH